VSSVVSAGFPLVVKVEALPPLWRVGKLIAGYVAMCCAFPGSSIGFCTWGAISSKNEGVGTLIAT